MLHSSTEVPRDHPHRRPLWPTLALALAASPGLTQAHTSPFHGKPAGSYRPFRLAQESAHRALTGAELHEVAGDTIGSYWLVKLRVDRLLRGGTADGALPIPELEATAVPLTRATARLVEWLQMGNRPDDWVARFYEEHRGFAFLALQVARKGSVDPFLAEANRRDGLQAELSMVSKFFALVQQEPEPIEEKVGFYLNRYTPWGTYEIVVIRLVELGPTVRDELLERVRQLKLGRAPVGPKPKDLVAVTVFVLCAAADSRIGEIKLEDIPENQKAARAYYEARLGAAEPDVRWTRAARFLYWSGSLMPRMYRPKERRYPEH